MAEPKPDANIGRLAQEAAHPEGLVADASLSQKPEKRFHNPPIDVEEEYGSEERFARKMAAEERKAVGAGVGVSSEEFFNKKGDYAFKHFSDYGHKTQEKALKEWGLTQAELSPEKIAAAMKQLWRDEANQGSTEKLPASASAAEIEKAVYKKRYNDLASGNYQIDFN